MRKKNLLEKIEETKRVIRCRKGPTILLAEGGYGFLFRWEHFVRTTRELEYLFFLSQILFPEFNIRLYDKNSESYYLFSSTKIRFFFFTSIGNQNIFFRKKT